MPTIISICPYCRRGGVRAPETALGGLATCPKCKSSFTVLPDDKLPEWVAKMKPTTNSFAQSSSPLEETRATATMPDRTEPSPVLPAEKRSRTKPTSKEMVREPKPEPAVTPTPEAAPPEALVTSLTPQATPQAAPAGPEVPPHSPLDMGLVCALVALILVGPAVLASQLPFGRFIGLTLAGIGLIGGLLCLGAEGKARIAAGGAAFLHFCAIVVLLFLPSWLKLDPWRGGGAAKEEPKGPLVVEHGSGLTAPLPTEPLDASRYSWQSRDVRVTVRRAAVAPVELLGPNGAKRTTKENYLHLILQVANSGVEREVPLSGWAAGTAEGISVTDANDTPLSLASFEAGWAPARGAQALRAMPGHSAEVRLLFAAPPPKTEFIRLRLSGSAFGEKDEIRFLARPTVVTPRTPGKS